MASSGARLGDLVHRLTRELRRRSHGTQLAPHQFRALRIIAEGPIRPARLAESLGITPRAVTDVVDSLTGAGLVAVSPDEQDRRAKVLSITAQGEQQRSAAKARRDEAAEALFAPLTADERQELARLLDKVVAANPTH